MIQKEEGLKRQIGVLGLSANIVNIIVGSGIFALPAIIAANMGSATIIAYVACGILITLTSLCFAEAGSKVTNTGGPYTYIETAFGNYAGFIGGVFFISAVLFADAAVSNAIVDILGTLYPVFKTEWIRLLFIFCLLLGLTAVNVIGIKQGIGLVKFNTFIKLTPLLLFILISWNDVSMNNLYIHSFPGFKTLGETSLILFFAFQGCESGLIVGGEVINPQRTIPKAILISISTVVIFYILIQTVCQGILGSELPYYKASPLAETARVSVGQIGFLIITLSAAFSMFGYLSGSVLNNPRVMYALSRDHVIPVKSLAKIHKSFATPYIAIIVYVIIGFLLAATGSFEQLVVIASSSMLVIYMGVALSVIKLRKSIKTKPGDFKIPGGIIIPVIAILIIVYFLSSLSSKELIATCIFIGFLTLVYGIIVLFKKNNP